MKIKASKILYTEVESYKEITYSMIFFTDGYPRENMLLRNGYRYFSVDIPKTQFSGRFRVYRTESCFYPEVRVGKKWVTWDDYDWDIDEEVEKMKKQIKVAMSKVNASEIGLCD